MRAFQIVISVAIGLVLTGCGGEGELTMPDVTNKKLDAAYLQMKDSGIDDEDKIKVDGGGLFGIVVESNWTVCKQSPAAGTAMPAEPKLTVKRSCKKKQDDVDEKASPSPTPTKDSTPSPAVVAKPETPDVITAKNSKEFAALLTLDECSDEIDNFAEKYPGQKIRFNGSISAFAAHEGMDTRFDMLVGAGDDGVNSASGPYFQFYDKNALQLKLTGDYPDSLAVDQRYTFTAEIDEYVPESCLLRLNPVETKVR